MIEFVPNHSYGKGWRVRRKIAGIHSFLCGLGIHAWEEWMERWEADPGELEQGTFYRLCAVCGKRRYR